MVTAIHVLTPYHTNNYGLKSKFKAFAGNKLIKTQNPKFVLRSVENIVGRRKKCWLTAFSPLPTIFSKAFLSRGVHSRDCVVKNSATVNSFPHNPDF